MTIRHLTIFVAVADHGSMSAAASYLYLSQPTISQAIRELEKHYNGLLFERLGRKLYLTERGRLLLPQARNLIRAVSADRRTDVKPGAVLYLETWFHNHGRNLPYTVSDSEASKTLSGSPGSFLCE